MTIKRPQWAERLAFFDIETTGVDVATSRIVSAAIAFLDNGQVSERYDWLVNPGVKIPPQAAAVHGITNEIAAASGMNPAAAVQQIIEKLRTAVDQGYTLVAFNASYDFSLLNYEALRYGFASITDIKPIADPYILDKHFDRYRRGKRQLSFVSDHYGISLANAHEAAADAIAAGQILYKIAEIYNSQLPLNVLELHENQIAWEEAQTLSFREYLKSQGRDYKNVVPGWPFRQ